VLESLGTLPHRLADAPAVVLVELLYVEAQQQRVLPHFRLALQVRRVLRRPGRSAAKGHVTPPHIEQPSLATALHSVQRIVMQLPEGLRTAPAFAVLELLHAEAEMGVVMPHLRLVLQAIGGNALHMDDQIQAAAQAFGVRAPGAGTLFARDWGVGELHPQAGAELAEAYEEV